MTIQGFHFLWTGLAVFLLLWALLAARRSPFDALLLGLAGLLLLFSASLPWLGPRTGISRQQVGILPELALAPIGLLLLLRVFFSRLGGFQRLGMGAVGCLILLPTLVLAGWISLWMFGRSSGVPHSANSQATANAAADNEAADNEADANEADANEAAEAGSEAER